MQGAKVVLTKHEMKQGKNNALLLKTQVSDLPLASLLPNLAMNFVQQVSEGQEDI